MSWSLTTSKVAQEDFDAAVDAAEPQGQNGELFVEADVEVAKRLLKVLARRNTAATHVIGSASGHALQPDQGNGWSNSFNINVLGFTE